MATKKSTTTRRKKTTTIPKSKAPASTLKIGDIVHLNSDTYKEFCNIVYMTIKSFNEENGSANVTWFNDHGQVDHASFAPEILTKVHRERV